jgi:hypothetical protein
MNLMNKEFQFTLQPYKGTSTRHTCPKCNKRNQFARYINTESLQPLADNVGRCNREVNCGYHYTPKQFFEDNPGFNSDNNNQNKTLNPLKKVKPKKPARENIISLIPFKVFDKTLQAYDNNNLVKFLIKRLGPELAEEAIQRYYLGTSKHWQGATIFWQIDINGRIRTGKVMLYNPENGKRVKKPFSHINWIHKIGNFKNYNLNQCLFGEHLLNMYPEKNIAIVESEKTALIASAYIPENNWLATGNLNNLSRKNIQQLKGKKVTLYPDAGAFHIWKEKAERLKDIADISISKLIETRATNEEKRKGFDLADYLTDKPLKFIEPKESEQNKQIPSKNISMAEIEKDIKESAKFFDDLNKENVKKEPLEFWPIEELEFFFNNTRLTDQPITIEEGYTVSNISKYIQTNLAIIKKNNGNPTFEPYYTRLLKLRAVISSFDN